MPRLALIATGLILLAASSPARADDPPVKFDAATVHPWTEIVPPAAKDGRKADHKAVLIVIPISANFKTKEVSKLGVLEYILQPQLYPDLYGDISHVVPVALQLGIYASPVAWATEAVPEKYRWFVQLNPLCGLIEAFRWSLLGQSTLHLHWLAYSVVTSVLVFWLGAVVFKRLEQDFADVI